MEKRNDASVVEGHQKQQSRLAAAKSCGRRWCLWRFLEPVGEGFDTPAVHVPIVAVSLDDGEAAKDLRRYDYSADLRQL